MAVVASAVFLLVVGLLAIGGYMCARFYNRKLAKAAMYCVYCNEDHDAAVKFSDEHIIPEALGGSRSFAIRVCETINNTFGNKVDMPFINMFPVNADRFFLDLPSHRGMPTLDLSGTTLIDGKERKIQSTVKEGEKVLKLTKPIVETTRESDRDLVTISADPQEARKILLGKLESATKQGKTMTHQDGTPVTPESIDRYIAQHAVTVNQPSILIELQLNGVDAVRFFCKVALATGFYIAGESFGRSSVADKLRTVIRSENIRDLPMPSAFWPFYKNAEAFKFFSIPDTHVLAVLPDEPHVLVISLFGGTYGALVPLHEDGTFEWPLTREGSVFQISVKDRKFKQVSYGDYLLARPWLPPSTPQ
jgi:hypothetical protein